MNSEEGMSMAKMAVTVLLVVLVIGAVVALVYAAYSWFSSGSDKLGDTVTSIDKSSFSQYDDAQVSGTDVLSALKSYRESDIAIFVVNKNLGGYKSTPDASTECYAFCALPASPSFSLQSGAADAGAYKGSVTYDSTKGRFEFAGFQYDGSGVNITKNTNFSPTTTAAKSNTYVKQSATWYSNIVYDSMTDEIAGIIFRQM